MPRRPAQPTSRPAADPPTPGWGARGGETRGVVAHSPSSLTSIRQPSSELSLTEATNHACAASALAKFFVATILPRGSMTRNSTMRCDYPSRPCFNHTKWLCARSARRNDAYTVRARRSATNSANRAGSSSAPPSARRAVPYNNSAVSATAVRAASSSAFFCASRRPVTSG